MKIDFYDGNDFALDLLNHFEMSNSRNLWFVLTPHSAAKGGSAAAFSVQKKMQKQQTECGRYNGIAR